MAFDFNQLMKADRHISLDDTICSGSIDAKALEAAWNLVESHFKEANILAKLP